MSPYLIDFQSIAEVSFLALTEYVNNNTIILVQTESLESISNLRQILRLEGITGVNVRLKDLALNVGGIDPKTKKFVCAPCSNCKGQLRDLFNYYKLEERRNIVYTGLAELIVNAMVEIREPILLRQEMVLV